MATWRRRVQLSVAGLVATVATTQRDEDDDAATSRPRDDDDDDAADGDARTPRGDANAGVPSEGREASASWAVNHGAAKTAAAPGSGQQRAPGIPELFKGGGEVEEYEWRWRWEAGGEKEPQL